MRKFSMLLICLLQGLFLLLYPTVSNAQNKGLLWQISGKNIKQPTYLFGTIHIYDTSLYKLPAPVMAKLAQVKKVYFELDFGHLNPAEIVKYAMVTDSAQQLNKLLDTVMLAKLKRAAKDQPTLSLLAMNGALYRFKPMFIMPMFLNNGKTVTIDMEMYKQAAAQKIAIEGLETVAEQMNAINTVTITKQAQMLTDFLKTYTGADPLIKKMTATYVKQDTDHLLEEMNEGAPLDADFNKALLIDRNKVMADRMSKAMGSQSTMFAVGAGHLGGKDGLITLLRKKGFVVKPVPFAFLKAH
ncbi:TraB/GumN family protein [Mucilaginibacter daejeonensis]|uniref:TraB/GumN family protein n=1 Tax=Mucilaginibacter daejeonensis TaxID=398049 RepID=UPI001D17ABF4|nr:TraB/GumN family protein [Mucilaginibacter daejeonensis]UEG54579.1 TraB/GumN family protein [Mucilaginibacter daejeonensis]